MALAAVACVLAAAVAGCGSEKDEPPGSTPGQVAPVGELAGPTIPLDDSGFDPLLALSVEAAGAGQTLIAGEVKLSRPQARGAGSPEMRIAIDGEREPDAEARAVGDDTVVVACACELQPGDHDIELQGRSVGGTTPIAARALVALDGVSYETDAPSGTGQLPAAISGSALETDSAMVAEAPTTLAQLDLADAPADSQGMVAVAEVGSTNPSVDPRGIALDLIVGDEKAARAANVEYAASAIDAFTLDSAPSSGEPVELIGNVVGAGSTQVDLRYLVVCPCGLETGS